MVQQIEITLKPKRRGLPAPLNMFTGLSHLFLELPASLGSLFRSSILHLQPSHLEVEGILALQHGGFSDRSCHNKYVFEFEFRFKGTKSLRNTSCLRVKNAKSGLKCCVLSFIDAFSVICGHNADTLI